MPVFLAQVELRFEADDLQACGQRLHELTMAIGTVGFTMTKGKVSLLPLSHPVRVPDGFATHPDE